MPDEILTIETEKLYDLSEQYMAVMCGFDRDTKGAKKIRDNAMKVRKKIFDGTKMDFLLRPFTKECVKEDHFLLENYKIECNILSKVDLESVLGGYVFMFHAPMPDLSSYPVSEMYLADSWQTSFVDAGRDVLRELLLKKAKKEYKKELYITDTLAPGMFGIASSKVRTFFRFMDHKKIDLELLESGMMNPVKSFVGIFLLLDQEMVLSSMNCSECLSGHKNCEYCKNYAARWVG
ncbi:MAG: hypothetical protein Q4B70_00245 [Lachnospiraceae bacterium]|nr:hypothetical protein [Lachnospiraceae bacterium]